MKLLTDTGVKNVFSERRCLALVKYAASIRFDVLLCMSMDGSNHQLPFIVTGSQHAVIWKRGFRMLLARHKDLDDE